MYVKLQILNAEKNNFQRGRVKIFFSKYPKQKKKTVTNSYVIEDIVNPHEAHCCLTHAGNKTCKHLS